MQEALAQPVVQLSPPFLRRHYRTIIVVSLLIADLISITLGFYLAYRVRLALPIPDQAQGVSRFLSLMPLLLVQAISIIIAFFFAKMYHRNRTRYSTDELQAILSGVSIGTLISIAVSAFTFKANFDYPRVMIIYAWIFTGVLVIVLRAVQAQAQRTLQARGYGRTRLLVVGSGDPVDQVLQRVRLNPRLGYDLVGVVGHGPLSPPNVRVLGDVAQLGQIVEREAIDEVILALHDATDEEMVNLISRCDRSTISIKVVPDMLQLMAGHMSIGELGGLPLLNVRDVALRGWRLSLKRAVDIVISAITLVLISPILLFIALLIKRDSPGSVFFVQERMGLDGRSFPMIKFRSMRIDAEQLGTWTVKDDPRRTRLGKLLRRTNIDELPQFINVILGDMSVVGPRPEQPYYVEEFRKQIPRYMERHREKAGITGWAQVNGLRGDTSIEERTKYDLWYVENWSVWLDIKIILRQLLQWIVVPDENAY